MIKIFQQRTKIIATILTVIAAFNLYAQTYSKNYEYNGVKLQTLKVSGVKIINEDGQEIYLRGFQGLGSYPIPDDLFIKAIIDKGADPSIYDTIAEDLLKYTSTDFDINEIKSTGANVVRIWTRVYEIYRGTNGFSDKAIKMLENTINKFGDKGIYTIIVLAGAGENNYDPQKVYLDRGINLFDPASDAMSASIKVWGELARRFNNNPNIAGYDVMNEPMPPAANTLHDYYVDLINEIRKYDKNHIIILPVAQGNRDTWQIGGAYADDNIAVTFHFYEPHNFTLEPNIHNQTYPGTYNGKYWDKNSIEEAFIYAINLLQLKDKPIYIGEFGAGGERDGNGGLEWTTDVLEIMNRYNLHYTYHNYKHSVHRGYWTKTAEAEEASKQISNGIFNGSIKYEDVTEEQKNNTFTTEKSCYQRIGIKPILTNAFNSPSTAIEIDIMVPDEFDLKQNHPNPFNPVTTINYSLAKEGKATIIVYDILGREVETIVNEFKPAGNYKIEFNGSNLSSGVYFYKFTSESFTQVRKMILLK